MKVLGLDLSLTATGIALVEDGVCVGKWLTTTQSDVADIERYAFVADEVLKRVMADPFSMQGDVDLVAIEGVYASRNLMTFGRLTALNTIVQYRLHRACVPYTILGALSWRKVLFGPGSKVDKERVRVAVAQRLKEHLGTMDVERVDNNVLEAFCVALAAWKVALHPELGPQKPARRARTAKAVA